MSLKQLVLLNMNHLYRKKNDPIQNLKKNIYDFSSKMKGFQNITLYIMHFYTMSEIDKPDKIRNTKYLIMSGFG